MLRIKYEIEEEDYFGLNFVLENSKIDLEVLHSNNISFILKDIDVVRLNTLKEQLPFIKLKDSTLSVSSIKDDNVYTFKNINFDEDEIYFNFRIVDSNGEIILDEELSESFLYDLIKILQLVA